MTNGQAHVVRALYYFPGDQPGDLLFEEGDVIDVYEMDDENWWEGKSRRTGEYGAFPSTLVEIINIGVAPSSNNSNNNNSQSNTTNNQIPLPSRPTGKGPACIVQFVASDANSSRNPPAGSLSSNNNRLSTMGPPDMNDGSNSPRFEANIQDDLLQLMQEAAMEAEGLTDRPLPPPPPLSASISSKASRADRPLPNLPNAAVGRELASVVEQQHPNRTAYQPFSVVDTISPDDSVSMVGHRLAFPSVMNNLPRLPETVESTPVQPPPIINQLNSKRLSLPAVVTTTTTTQIRGRTSTPQSPTLTYQQQQQQIPHMSMPEPQIWNMVSITNALPLTHQQRHSISAGMPVNGPTSPVLPNPARPLPQPPKKDRHYSLPNDGIMNINNSNNSNNSSSTSNSNNGPPVLLPKPPKSVISSVIGIPRVNNHNGITASNGAARNGLANTANRPAYPSPITPTIPASPKMSNVPHVSSPGSFVLTQAEMNELSHPAPPSVLGSNTNMTASNQMPLHIPGQVPYTGKENSVQLLNQCVNVRDMSFDGIDFNGTDLRAVDKYVRNIQHISHSITVDVLTMKFLARPFRTDLQRVRAIFIWMTENIKYMKLAGDGEGGEKRRPRTGISANEDPMPSVRSDLETAESTLKDRCCSKDGFALLFHKMASTAGIHSGIVRGYLKDPKDELDSNQLPPPNHCWNVVRIDGEYRFIDTALAVPSHPWNNLREGIQYQYFLTPPNEIAYTHFPADPNYQYLQPPISPALFRALPFVKGAYFDHEVDLFCFTHNQIELRNQESAQVTFGLADGIRCFAEVELIGTQAKTRALTQCFVRNGRRFARILVRLKGNPVRGFLKVYVGPPDFSIQDKLGMTNLPLAFVIRVKHRGQYDPPDFMQLFPTPHEFYIREPLDLELRNGQTYTFRVQAVSEHQHKKLSLRAPSTREHNFAYYPNDQGYVLSITIKEGGTWSLIYHTEKDGKPTIAQYQCKDGPKPKK